MSDDKSWDELRQEFCHVAFKRGIEVVAGEIPAGRATVYRIVRGDTERPSLAIRAGIERLVTENEEQER